MKEEFSLNALIVARSESDSALPTLVASEGQCRDAVEAPKGNERLDE